MMRGPVTSGFWYERCETAIRPRRDNDALNDCMIPYLTHFVIYVMHRSAGKIQKKGKAKEEFYAQTNFRHLSMIAATIN